MIALCFRIQRAKCEQLPIVDVDGSYNYRKQQSLMQSGITVAPLDPPAPPLPGWQVVTKPMSTLSHRRFLLLLQVCKRTTVVSSLKSMTEIFMHAGTLYMYLACGVGCPERQGAFRVLTRGYNYWASGRLDQLQVNTAHPCYCHIRGTTTPSMKPGSYHVYLLLRREGEVASIETATSECAAG